MYAPVMRIGSAILFNMMTAIKERIRVRPYLLGKILLTYQIIYKRGLSYIKLGAMRLREFL